MQLGLICRTDAGGPEQGNIQDHLGPELCQHHPPVLSILQLDHQLLPSQTLHHFPPPHADQSVRSVQIDHLVIIIHKLAARGHREAGKSLH